MRKDRQSKNQDEEQATIKHSLNRNQEEWKNKKGQEMTILTSQ